MKAISDVKLNYMIGKVIKLINNNHDSDPYAERTVDVVPLNNELKTISFDSTKVLANGMYWDRKIELPVPVYLDKYAYEFKLTYYGLSLHNESYATLGDEDAISLSICLVNSESEPGRAYDISAVTYTTSGINEDIDPDNHIVEVKTVVDLRGTRYNESRFKHQIISGYEVGSYRNYACRYSNQSAPGGIYDAQMNGVGLHVGEYEDLESASDVRASTIFKTYGITLSYKALRWPAYEGTT